MYTKSFIQFPFTRPDFPKSLLFTPATAPPELASDPLQQLEIFLSLHSHTPHVSLDDLNIDFIIEVTQKT